MTTLRETNVALLNDRVFDVLVVGGGINGAVSAACLAARGVKVALVDRSDFASATCQQSSNLAWGGIKYMETFEFPLVRKLCVSRNHLLESYPSTVKEIRFFATLQKGFRHGRFKLFLGALLYWLIGSFHTKAPRLLGHRTIESEEPIVRLDDAEGGIEYSDAYLHDNDARFVWNFVRGALDHGCVAANYVEATGARREDGLWHVALRDRVTGKDLAVKARVVVNACGPWVDPLNRAWGKQTQHRHVFSKGIHLIVPRLTEHRRVLTFFADDGRLFFAIPLGNRTCIGTTDTRADAPEAVVTDDDRRFVLDNINKRLKLAKPLTMSDVIAERCGVRPLVVKTGAATKSGTEWSQLSRKHVVEENAGDGTVAIFGGKLTDCLNVGQEVEDAVRRLGVAIPYPNARWYGEPGDDVREEYFHQARLMGLDEKTTKTASEPLSTRLWRRYGAHALQLLEEIRSDPRAADIVVEGTEYLRCELELTAKREMVVKLDDFLRRRSKIALVTPRQALLQAEGLREACRLLFGDAGDERLVEYTAAPAVAGPVVAHDEVAA